MADTRTYMPQWHRTDRHLEALLLEIVREGGRPVRKRKLWLGGIPVNQIDDPELRRNFWNLVATRLDRLQRWITPAKRAEIEATLAQRVKRPAKPAGPKANRLR
jgi:hypothetical protein